MSQRDVAFVLELVARALGGRMGNDPEESTGVSLYTLEGEADSFPTWSEIYGL